MSLDITPAIPAGRQLIDGYGGGGFRIGGAAYGGSVIVLPEAVHPWTVDEIAQVNVVSLASVLEARPPVEVLLLGTGSVGTRPERAVLDALSAAGIVLESMDTGAACRTFNVLLAEDRRVAAALLAVA
jgi:uncharacterized protein